MNFRFLSMLLVVIFSQYSCRKSDNNQTPDIPVPPPSISVDIDSIIYTHAPGSDLDDYRSSVYTFVADTVNGFFKVFRKDSLRQYNYYTVITLTETSYFFQKQTDKLLKISSKSKFLPDPTYPLAVWQSDPYDNYEITFEYLGDQPTPYEMNFRQFKDSTLSQTTGIINKSTRDFWNGDIWQATPTQSYGELFHSYYNHALSFNSTLSADASVNSNDSILIYMQNEHNPCFTNWLVNLGNHSVYNFDEHRFYLDASKKSIKYYVAKNSAVNYIAVGAASFQTVITPNLERKINFESNEELALLIENLGGKAYVKNLEWLIFFYPGLAFNEVSITANIKANGIDFIDRLKWFSTSSTDSLLDTQNGQRNVIDVLKSNSIISKDSKGRINYVTRTISDDNWVGPSLIERLDFIYKK